MTLEELLSLPLSERIKRVRNGLSHDKFAKALGTSRQRVIAWEHGSRPRREYAERLALYSKLPVKVFRASPEEDQKTLVFLLRQVEDLNGRVAQLEGRPPAQGAQPGARARRRGL